MQHRDSSTTRICRISYSSAVSTRRPSYAGAATRSARSRAPSWRPVKAAQHALCSSPKTQAPLAATKRSASARSGNTAWYSSAERFPVCASRRAAAPACASLRRFVFGAIGILRGRVARGLARVRTTLGALLAAISHAGKRGAHVFGVFAAAARAIDRAASIDHAHLVDWAALLARKARLQPTARRRTTAHSRARAKDGERHPAPTQKASHLEPDDTPLRMARSLFTPLLRRAARQCPKDPDGHAPRRTAAKPSASRRACTWSESLKQF